MPEEIEKTPSECLRRDRGITQGIIGAHVVITLVICIVLTAITGMPLIGFLVGIIIWTCVLFKTPVFDWTFVNVKPNWALLLRKQTSSDELPTDKNQRTKAFHLASIREVGPGIRGKLPHEVVVESIDTQSETVIGTVEGGSKLQCYTRNNVPLEIGWQDVLTPLRGYLVNMVRKGEDASKAFFRGEFEQFIINWVKGKDEADVFSSLEDLKREFSDKIFGGPDKISPKEEEYGMFTNTPQIISVTRSTRFQQAAEGEEITKKVGNNIKTIHAEFKDGLKPDPNVVLAAASAAAGIKVDGLLLIPGIGGDRAGDILANAARHGIQPSGTSKRGDK